ncbi:hypothetical protein CISG_07173 [Coccidioides immitis RMSCC 3703]|uniref:Uncharacterized protein n=1 Tax=Coccidioides immitis RMSCC 3703 TaxID=454286 RepID=A0A0J8TX02_COCIT|nr:hypothetical protein CISG_07173 [Coccidioides immitis RMSCC 3703]
MVWFWMTRDEVFSGQADEKFRWRIPSEGIYWPNTKSSRTILIKAFRDVLEKCSQEGYGQSTCSVAFCWPLVLSAGTTTDLFMFSNLATSARSISITPSPPEIPFHVDVGRIWSGAQPLLHLSCPEGTYPAGESVLEMNSRMQSLVNLM